MSILIPSPKRDAMVGVLLPLDAPGGPAPAGASPSTPGAPGAPGTPGGGGAAPPPEQLRQQLVPLDPRLPRCIVTRESLEGLPDELRCVRARLLDGTEPCVASLRPQGDC